MSQSPEEEKHKERQLPYYEIPDYPESYNAGTVAARVVDGLGFRYHWATEGLREEDLAYRPSEDSRSTFQTIDHIYYLSTMIINSLTAEINERPPDNYGLSLPELRQATLENIETVSKTLSKSDDAAFGGFKAAFQGRERRVEYPFWNMLNGPIADALYHTGQIVAFRRASGNPINPKAKVFFGKLK